MQKHLEDNIQHHLLLSNHYLTKEVVAKLKDVLRQLPSLRTHQGVWKAAVVGN